MHFFIAHSIHSFIKEQERHAQFCYITRGHAIVIIQLPSFVAPDHRHPVTSIPARTLVHNASDNLESIGAHNNRIGNPS
jgi:hypothetical protein